MDTVLLLSQAALGLGFKIIEIPDAPKTAADERKSHMGPTCVSERVKKVGEKRIWKK